jgi:phosphatidylglycerol---prolipoprotein diacylglyceryl transferase
LHFPISIEIGSLKILLHAILEPLGIFVGFRYFLFLRKKKGDRIESGQRLWIIIGAIFGALIGSRLVGGFENPGELFNADNPFIYLYQNKTVVGGFLGGLFAVEIIKKLIKEKQSSGDLFTYPMILALIIGRIGCFSMGVYEETYGTATNFFTGMNLGDGVYRHPVTLYEIFFLMLLWIGMIQLEKRFRLVDGGRFKIFMIAYLFFRLLLDFIKPHFTYDFGLSTIQLVCLTGLIYYASYILKPKKLIIPQYA